MLIPRRLKHRKQHHPTRRGVAKGGTNVSFGEYGIQAIEPGYITNRQIESARIAITRAIKRGGKVWITIYPDRPRRPRDEAAPLEAPVEATAEVVAEAAPVAAAEGQEG